MSAALSRRMSRTLPSPQGSRIKDEGSSYPGGLITDGESNYQGRDVTVSISACDADCAGANPVALTILSVSKFALLLVSRAFASKLEIIDSKSSSSV